MRLYKYINAEWYVRITLKFKGEHTFYTMQEPKESHISLVKFLFFLLQM